MKDAELVFYGQYVPDIEKTRFLLIAHLENLITKIDSDELIAEHMKSRVKKVDSACEKLEKAGLPTTPESALANLSDVIGIRIVTRFIGDIYTLLDASDALPQTIVLNKDGVIIYNVQAPLTYEQLEALLKKAEQSS